MDLLTPSDPRKIGDIELHGMLGEGGMGKVYFGVTPRGDQVAVKVIKKEYADRDDVRERFDREILAMGMVQGPGVAALVAAAEPGAEQPWLAMEYIRGLTLRDYVQSQGALDAELGAVLGDLLAEALMAVHAAGLLHRDLKPANIMLGADGPKVIDFGLVALGEGAQELTKSADMLGTPSCMSPEQVRSAKELTAATDVYALGASLLYALTEHYPYERPTVHALLYAIMEAEIEPDLAGVPPELDPVVRAMLTHEPDERPTLAEVSQEFHGVFGRAGLSLSAGRIRLGAQTYREEPDDLPTDIEPPTPPRPRRRRERVPTPAVARLADRLRSAYARPGPL